MMTRVVNQEKLETYVAMTKQKEMEGRAQEALQIKRNKELKCKTQVEEEQMEQKPIPKSKMSSGLEAPQPRRSS